MVYVPVHAIAAKGDNEGKSAKTPSAAEQMEGLRVVLTAFSFLLLFAGLALLAVA